MNATFLSKRFLEQPRVAADPPKEPGPGPKTGRGIPEEEGD